MPYSNVSTINAKRTDYPKRRTDETFKIAALPFWKTLFRYERTRTDACHLSIYDLLPYMIRILRTFATSIWHTIFLFTNYCIRSFDIRSFGPYDLPTNFCLRTSGIRSSSLRTFAYDLSAYDLSPNTIIYLRTFAYECLTSDLFLYELFLRIFCRAVFCPIRSFAYEHLLANLRHTNIRHTNFCPVTGISGPGRTGDIAPTVLRDSLPVDEAAWTYSLTRTRLGEGKFCPTCQIFFISQKQ